MGEDGATNIAGETTKWVLVLRVGS